MTDWSRPEGLVRVWSYLMATTNRSFRYSYYPRANLYRRRGDSRVGKLTAPCHRQPEVKGNFLSVLFAQMQNCLCEEVQCIFFQVTQLFYTSRFSPCEIRKGWGKANTIRRALQAAADGDRLRPCTSMQHSSYSQALSRARLVIKDCAADYRQL